MAFTGFPKFLVCGVGGSLIVVPFVLFVCCFGLDCKYVG